MPIIPFGDHTPVIGSDCFIAPDAWVTGLTTLGNAVSVFFGASLRGDINAIVVGDETNIQEHAILHTSHGLGDCRIGKQVTVGHHAIIHGAHISDNALIGMAATILDGASIGEKTVIGANSLVPMRATIPAGVLALGTPARVIRDLTTEEIENITRSAKSYVQTGARYARECTSMAQGRSHSETNS
jgi:carbonic anhydrase/acetyltransferase-like protein (isoleucine patch superfamily)